MCGVGESGHVRQIHGSIGYFLRNNIVRVGEGSQEIRDELKKTTVVVKCDACLNNINPPPPFTLQSVMLCESTFFVVNSEDCGFAMPGGGIVDEEVTGPLEKTWNGLEGLRMNDEEK